MSKKVLRQKKKLAEKEFKKKVGLFNKLGDHCLVCQKDFDKQNKEMVMSWSVVVRRESETVRLYCPACWEMAKKVVKETENGITNTTTDV